MNLLDGNTAALQQHEAKIARLYQEQQDLGDQVRSRMEEIAEDEFGKLIADGESLEQFDSDHEALYGHWHLVAAILRAYKAGEPLLSPVEALYDHFLDKFCEVNAERFEARAWGDVREAP